MNNPVNFYDPNGMSAFSDAVHNKLDSEGGHTYFNWWMANALGGDGRLRADPNGFNNIGRYHRDLGPGAPIAVDGESYTPLQDPITGMYYYDKEIEAHSEPYYGDEYVDGYKHTVDSRGTWKKSNYQAAGTQWVPTYTVRIYINPEAEKANWLNSGYFGDADPSFRSY